MLAKKGHGKTEVLATLGQGEFAAGGAIVPNLRETLIPFADSVPWPVIVVDESGIVLYVNDALRATGRDLPIKGPRALAKLFPDYFAALKGNPGWLTPQEVVITRNVAPGFKRHERVWVRRLPKGSCLIIVDETRLNHLESAHAQTARLASLGFMLASVSHEISNPLSAVYSILQVLQSKKGASTETLEKGLRNIASSVRRILAITRKLNVFARASSEVANAFAIDAAIDEAAAIVGYDSLGETVELSHEANADAWVYGHVDQLQQVFYNIFLNAAQAMHGTGSISVKTILSPTMVEIVIRDNGPGLAHDLLAKVFEPFFTTKPSGEGTGLGLAISHEIIHEHDGTIRAENHPDGGAVFIISLPTYVGPR